MCLRVGMREAWGLVVGFVCAYYVSVQVQGCSGVYRGCVWVVPGFHGGLHRVVSGVGFAAVRC